MKKTVKIFLIALALGAGSCTKFLEENPTGALTPESDVTSPEIARAFTNSGYSQLTVLDRGAGGYGGNTASMTEFMTGKAFGNNQAEANKFYNLVYDAAGFYIDAWWQGLYYGVNNCNLALQKVGEIQQDTVTKQNQLAEIYALRAMYYFYLVRIFGDVPKVTGIATDLNDVRPPRAPVKEIYDEIIIPDLLTAEKSSLPWKDETGKVSMGAVKTLLADVYLTYAGFPVQGGDQFYAESAKRSKEVITSGGFTLFPEYRDMIKPANKNKGEFIWQVQFAAGISDNDMTAKTLPQFLDIAVYSDEFGGLIPTEQFISSYPAGDKRTWEKQFYYTWHRGNPNTYPAGDPRRDSLNLGGHHLYKWYDSLAVNSTAHSDLNYTIYRLADALLLYAEASNRAEGGPNADALGYVNMIRDRARLTPIGALSQDAFEKEVWSQRYFELAFENKMWFDMIRTRKVRNDLTKNFDDFVGHTTTWNKTFTEKQLLFAIPQREINNNTSLTQNTGF